MPHGGHFRGAAQALWLTLLFVLPFVWGGGVVAVVAVLVAAVVLLRISLSSWSSVSALELRLLRLGPPIPVIIGLAALLYLVFSYSLPPSEMAGLQGRWGGALAASFSQGLSLGRGLVADRGPLGCLLAGRSEADSQAAWLAWEFLWRLPLLVLLVSLVWGLGARRRWLFLGLGLVYGALQPGVLELFLVVLLWLRWVLPVGTPWFKVLTAVLLLALLSLGDFTCFLISFGGLALLGLGSLGSPQWKRGLFLPFVLVVAFGLLWELLGQNSMRIPAWFHGAWEHFVWRAWSHAVPVPGYLAFAGALCCLASGLWLLCGGLGLRLNTSLTGFPDTLLRRADRGWRDLRSREQRLACLLLFACLFAVYRQAFTDTDASGAGFFTLALLVTVFRLESEAEERQSWSSWLVIPALLGLWLPGPAGAGSLLGGRAATWLAALVREVPADLAVSPGGLPEISSLPKETAGRSVGLPFDGAEILPQVSLRQASPPVPLARMACVERFQLLNREYYRSARGPAFVLARWEGGADRWCNQEGAWVLAELPVLFEPLLEEAGFLLLRRRAGATTPEGGMGELVEQRNLPWAEEWRLPGERKARHWLRIYVRPSLLGRLRALLLRPELPRLVLTDEAGIEYRHRILPGSAGEGLMLQPYVASQQDLVAFLRGQSGHRLRSFRFECPVGHEEYWKPPAAALLRMRDVRTEDFP